MNGSPVRQRSIAVNYASLELLQKMLMFFRMIRVIVERVRKNRDRKDGKHESEEQKRSHAVG